MGGMLPCSPPTCQGPLSNCNRTQPVAGRADQKPDMSEEVKTHSLIPATGQGVPGLHPQASYWREVDSSTQTPGHLDMEVAYEPPVKEQQLFSEASAKLPVLVDDSCMFVDFKASGETKTVVFRSRPTGLQFGNRVPLVVQSIKPNFPASGSVEIGWVLTAVNGINTTCMDYRSVVHILNQGLSDLRVFEPPSRSPSVRSPSPQTERSESIVSGRSGNSR